MTAVCAYCFLYLRNSTSFKAYTMFRLIVKKKHNKLFIHAHYGLSLNVNGCIVLGVLYTYIGQFNLIGSRDMQFDI